MKIKKIYILDYLLSYADLKDKKILCLKYHPLHCFYVFRKNMISQDGIIDVAEFCSSPNFDERPNNAVINLIVIHAISLPVGSYNTQLIKDLFLNCLDPGNDEFLGSIKDLKVSSHFLITRKGRLIQFVPTDKRAWHAGISHHKGRENCNDFSIGIELEGCDEEEFEQQQYQSLSSLIKFLSHDFQINKQNIVGHADIAPGRKTDPGPFFDWTLLQSML